MKKKLSVIIPVYNGERYIGRCIESVLDQTNFLLKDAEIILLNDGSKDSSLSILEKYKTKYPEVIRVIDKQNSGVAKTRNEGIRIAEGEYVIFIDQDDYLEPEYFERFYSEAKTGGYDIVVGGYRRPNENEKILRTVTQPNTDYSVRYKISAAWAKIHRTKFLRENHIEFYDNNYGEDIIFTMMENRSTDKIKGINYVGHNWFWNTGSVSNTSQRGLKENIKISRLLRDMFPYVINDLDRYYVLQTAVHYLLFSGRSATPESFMKLYKEFFALLKENDSKYLSNPLILIGPSGALLSVRISISVFMLLHRLNLIGMFAKIYSNGRI